MTINNDWMPCKHPIKPLEKYEHSRKIHASYICTTYSGDILHQRRHNNRKSTLRNLQCRARLNSNTYCLNYRNMLSTSNYASTATTSPYKKQKRTPHRNSIKDTSTSGSRNFLDHPHRQRQLLVYTQPHHNSNSLHYDHTCISYFPNTNIQKTDPAPSSD